MFSCFNISSPGFVEPGTFLIEKFCPIVKIWRVKVGHYAQVSPQNIPERGPNCHFWNTFFWITFPKIDIFMPFFLQLLTSGCHRDAHSRIFDFWLFWPKNGLFWRKILENPRFCPKTAIFWPKSQKIQNRRLCFQAKSLDEQLVKNGEEDQF